MHNILKCAPIFMRINLTHMHVPNIFFNMRKCLNINFMLILFCKHHTFTFNNHSFDICTRNKIFATNLKKGPPSVVKRFLQSKNHFGFLARFALKTPRNWLPSARFWRPKRNAPSLFGLSLICCLAAPKPSGGQRPWLRPRSAQIFAKRGACKAPR